ncbi:MAG: hypothetical protein IJX46_03805, partial [Clostridia bacterium]|nr:hypothetical protein [Clostridia bacterium]
FIASTSKAKDTAISRNQSTTNFGSASRVPVNQNYTALFQMALPSLPYGSTYNNIAYLCLSYYFGNSNEGYVDLNVYKMNGVWSETGATYANSASLIDGTALSTETVSWYDEISQSAPGFESFDISNTVRDWYSGDSTDWQPSYGFAVKYSSTSTIAAVFFKSSECGDSEFTPFISVSYTTTIADGVYSLENLYYDNHYINADGYASGTSVDTTSPSTEPTNENSPNRSALFKISRDSEGNYIIRSMRNNALGFDVSGNSLAFYSIPTDDDDVDDWDKFQITWSNTDYSAVMIHPNESTNVINMSSSTSFNQVDEGIATASAKWRLTRYSGAALNGVGMSNFDGSLNLGETFDYDAYMYSSSIGVNGPVTYSVRDTDYTSTYEASINASDGLLLTQASGDLKIGVTYSGAPYVWYWNINIIFYGCRGYDVIPPLKALWCYKEVNCHGYALNYVPTEDKGGDKNPLRSNNWLIITESEWETVDDSNDLLDIFKWEFQKWMTDNIGRSKWEDVTDHGGINASLESNQWLVVMRVGYHPEYYDPFTFSTNFDYHFWYRTSEGEWVNKHGFGSASEPLGDDLPTDNGSLGWHCGQDKPYYYDSDLIYYRITA